MENPSLHQLFAKDKDGWIRSIEEVSRGLSRECFCPSCGAPVVARQGSVREWHFAHAVETECKGGMKTALHLAAKQLLLRSAGLTIPAVMVKREVKLPDGRIGKGEASRPERWVRFVSVEAEKNLGLVRPDIFAVLENGPLFIEIAVTHFVDEEKRSALVGYEASTLEIDLSNDKCRHWTWQLLTEYVINNANRKNWIRMVDDSILNDEALHSATVDALQHPIPSRESKPTANSPVIRTRFWIKDRMVDTIERPFGIAIWSPYDPELNEVIKRIARNLGGKWQPRFKNWLLPLDAKSWLFQEFTQLSERPPERKL